MNRKIIALLVSAIALVCTVTACSDDADVASENLSKAADNFEIPRRVVFVNGITDKYLFEIDGYCSIKDEGNQLEVTCKTEDGKYVKHFLGLSDNVTYFVEQTAEAGVSTDHYRVTWKPESILPAPNAQ